MLASTARVATEHPTTYLRRLCEHFTDPSQRHSAQEFDVTFDEHHRFIDFAPVVSGACRLEAQAELLVVEATGTDRAALGRVQRIASKHLERFERGDGLTVEWGASSDLPSTG